MGEQQPETGLESITLPPPEPSTLLEALLAFQAQAPTLQKDASNPHFKNRYVSLDAITQAITPVLTACGLVWITTPGNDEDDAPVLSYRLAHSKSGEELTGRVRLMLPKNDSQGWASALTYARRYTISAVLGLSAEDDDGDAASQGRGVTAAPVQPTERTVSAKQRGLVNAKAAEKGLDPIQLAEIVLAATEAPAKSFEHAAQATDWLRRAMDRLPARYVDPILLLIEQHE